MFLFAFERDGGTESLAQSDWSLWSVLSFPLLEARPSTLLLLHTDEKLEFLVSLFGSSAPFFSSVSFRDFTAAGAPHAASFI